MPNWCQNTLKITGDKKELIKFKKKAKSYNTKLSLAKLYPEPDYSKVRVKPTFPSIINDPSTHKKKYVNKKQAWWDWRIQNWGTKWDIEAELTDNGTGLCYDFDSAWSPPVSWIKKVSKDYPKLQFRLKYREEGIGFKGVSKAQNGKVSDKQTKL